MLGMVAKTEGAGIVPPRLEHQVLVRHSSCSTLRRPEHRKKDHFTSCKPLRRTHAAYPLETSAKKPHDAGRQLTLPVELTFPDHHHAPTSTAQKTLGRGVSFLVALQFPHPVQPIRCRNSVSSRAIVQVPEAAVHEDHALARRKHQVRRSGQVGSMQSISIAEAVHQSTQREFGLRISRANTRHDIASLHEHQRLPDCLLLLRSKES